MSDDRKTPSVLHETEEQFRLLVNSVEEYAIYMLDAKGRILTWNPGAERIQGYAAADIIGQNFACFFTMENLIADKPRKDLETASLKGATEDESWRVRKDGSRFFANVVITAMLDEAGIVCGYQDAYMCVLGGLSYLDFYGKHPIDSGPLGTLLPAELPGQFLLVTTGVERLSGSVHGPIRERWLNGDQQVIEHIKELANLARAIKISAPLDVLAEAMTRNFQIIQELGGSGADIDRLVQGCLDNGALSAKLAGAGMGGTVIALCDDPSELQQRLSKIGYTKFLQPTPTIGLLREA